MRKLTFLLSLAFCSLSNMVSAQTFTADKVYKITNYSEGLQAQIMPEMQYFGGTAKGTTLHLGNLFRIIPTDANGTSYTICSYADNDRGIYLISNKDANQMVGVGSLSALSAAAVKTWSIISNTTNSGSYNIRSINSNGNTGNLLNPRGSEPNWSSKGISLWNTDISKATNCWNITEVSETEIEAAVTAFKSSYLQHADVASSITSKDKESYGYPSYEYAQAVKEANATEDNAEKLKKTFYAAKYYLSAYNITMPKEGEVFTITNIFTDGTENWLCNVNGTNVMKSATDAAKLSEDAKRWVVQKVSGTTCFFASAAGDGVLRFKGNTSGSMTFTLGSGKDDMYPYTSLYASAYMNNNKTTFAFDQFSNLNNSNIVNGEFTNTSKGTYSIKYKLTKVDNYDGFKVNFASSSDGNNYATLNLPFAVTLPDGVTAYKATQDGSLLNLTEFKQAGNVLPYATPVLLTSTAEGEKTFMPAAYEAQVATGFSGTLAPTAVSTANTYILAKDNDKVSFFLLDGTDNTINANKAYFVAASTNTAAQSLSFNFGNVTGISQVQTAISNNAPIYDLSGRRVDNAKKAGIYIQQGKKIIVK